MINNQKEKHFSYQLEKAINESDLTMPEIIRKTGIQSATFNRWKEGKVLPRLSSLKKLAKVFGKNVAWFIGSLLFLIELN
ncbi:helix-turn-helix domain-containing protein [Oenococcus oeni]|uniref:HTH cro/C1-type domain-containing protein n=1 Tax=Oenoccocus phage fOgPSU1 TaxID=264986 RepID=Q6EVM2_9CAUD|nr:helix-turn-helix transcriptional regulator [Oenococcus oeni]CAF32669.1 hypothetical protein [Oenoccocus phage fOgPSU1]EJN93088.1 transcriptional regulator, Cro/CI family [Oenococcus oeni AWRIB304]EJO02390.1 transcriptional regulator, Cro/CI family [Oenococcus oeni AWRIB318]EKP89561.1 transcriptional regulator, Cro/CI family [Oenococcus oeni AWRIB202]KER91158.1 Cro/Cl family transcriptional regulator [Oenococcus oeni]